MPQRQPKRLTAAAVARALKRHPGWKHARKSLVRTFQFPTYRAGLDFVMALGRKADVANHHPDLLVGWRKVKVRWTTHDAGGLTAKDLKGVRMTEGI